MSDLHSKVIWSEGIFISPQHFQQQDRYFEFRIEQAYKLTRGYQYGLCDITFDKSALKDGLVTLNRLFVVFHNGMIIDFNDRELPFLKIEIPPNTKEQLLYVILPDISMKENQFSFDEATAKTRYLGFDKTLTDVTNVNFDPRTISLAQLNPRLVLEQDVGIKHQKIPIARLSSNHTKEIFIDTDYIPLTINAQNQAVLKSYISEVYSLLSQRSNSLSTGVNDPNRGGSVEVVDFLMLQTTNRYLAYMQHQNLATNHTHPEDLYIELSKLCADLMTFLPERKVRNLPSYDHDDLSTCYTELMNSLRLVLGTVIEQRVIRIPLHKHDEATHVAQTPNTTLLDLATFVLAVKADMPMESIQQRIPTTLKISTTEKIKDLIAFHLPGVKTVPLSTAPRELPYHNGYTYFELDKNTEMWQLFTETSGMAFHLAGEFPGLDLEFWAIKPIKQAVLPS